MFKLTLRSLLFPIVIVFLFIPHCLSIDRNTQELIDKVCRSTFDYGYCANVFKKNLYTPHTDIRGLAEIAITESLIHATDTLKFVVGLIDSGRNVELLDLYKICEVTYENMVHEFTDASFAFARGDYRIGSLKTRDLRTRDRAKTTLKSGTSFRVTPRGRAGRGTKLTGMERDIILENGTSIDQGTTWTST
ncbi:invertase/pectin methylesterase inhibitor family protein [Striga asiatica]|uniref:Invertase/pectin methylesterase inhibitor family protein n=1 Tax=Striga asiatica TaxID=4170 RepID=A0A5A7R9M5_STRAF|nr:invertase/pectin methylesterase inhibitor family protein [Striga asiatica]